MTERRYALIGGTGVSEGERITGFYESVSMFEECGQEVTAEGWYFDGEALVPRPGFVGTWDKLQVLADGVDLMTIDGLTLGARVTAHRAPVDEDLPVEVPVIDGKAQIGFTTPGTYEVRVEDWPQQVYTVTAEAVEPI